MDKGLQSLFWGRKREGERPAYTWILGICRAKSSLPSGFCCVVYRDEQVVKKKRGCGSALSMAEQKSQDQGQIGANWNIGKLAMEGLGRWMSGAYLRRERR